MRTSQMLFLIIIFPVVSGCAWRSFFLHTDYRVAGGIVSRFA